MLLENHVNQIFFSFIGSPIPKVFWDMILNTMKYRDENGIVRKDYLDFLRELRKPKNSPYGIYHYLY